MTNTFTIKTGDEVEIKVGDRIKFRAVTRGGAPTLTRIVTGFAGYARNNPEVSAHGYRGFVVRPDEIINVYPAGDAS